MFRKVVIAAVIGCAAVAQLALAQPQIEKTKKIEAGGIYELAVSPSGGTVYVAATGNQGDPNPGRIVALDAETLEVKKDYDVSQTPLFGLALNDTTQILYGTSPRLGKVVALDLASGEIVGVIGRDASGSDALGGDSSAHVRQVAVDDVSNTIYASVIGSRNPEAENAVPSELWVIDGATHSLTRAIELKGTTLTGLAVDPGAGHAYLTDMMANRVVVVDLASGEAINSWSSGGDNAINIAVDTASGRLFVAHQGSGSVTAIDAVTGALLGSAETGEGALAVAFNAGHDQLYVTNRRAGTTSVVDATTYEVVATLKTGTLPQSLAINPVSGVVYASNKARGLPRNAPADAEPVVDERGDTVVRIRP